jgi:hypothetical protein
METKFNELMKLLNDSAKETKLRILFNNATNLEKIQLMATIQDFLGIEQKSTIEIFKDIVLK